MNTLSKIGIWCRNQGEGDQSVWTYMVGPRFSVEMLCDGDSRLLLWCVNGDLRELGHWRKGRWVRAFLKDCWELHLTELTGHERMEYVALGLIRETD